MTPHVAVERDGALFFLPTRQKSGLDRFAKQEWKEKRHLERALAALSELEVGVPGSTFVDVGAHVGTTTITAVRRFGFESALALEPEPENFRLLRANLGINGLETTIRTLNVAVSDHVGNGELVLQPESGTRHHLLKPTETASETLEVPLTTLDTLVAEGNVDPAESGLLWLDVEGHELEVIRGARSMLRRSVPLVMEFTPRKLRSHGRLDALQSLLEPGYTHVVDLRQSRPGSPAVGRLDALDQLAERYSGGFTDVLTFTAA